jgi:aminoglycoside phosphotransferase (APT) family kinase protein
VIDPELLALLEAALPGARIADLLRLSGGASRGTWSFTADDRRLIVQRGRAGAERLGIGAQATIMTAAARAGVPVPAVLATGASGSDEWMLVEHIDGETIPRKILRDPALAAARDGFARQAGKVLAGVHGVDVDALDVPEEIDPVERWRAILGSLGAAQPALELGLRWLALHRPPPTGRTLVHGDFRLGNLILGPDGIRAVLDWELAHVGDPMEDLGWLCVRSWRFGAPLPVAGLGGYEQLWSSYERASGRGVDPEVARWWEVFGNVRWGIICLLQAATHLSGAERSVELATIGRRVCEVEWDLLELVS